MSLDVSLLPLRCTDSREDFVGMLSSWMDSLPPSLGLRSNDCREDLYKLSTLRQSIAESIPHKDSYEEALQCLDNIHTYYHYLLECEERGLKSSSITTTNAAPPLLSPQPEFLRLEWESALTGQIQVVSNNLGWDRVGLIWNLVALEAYLATQQSLDSKASWNAAAQHLQNAACWLQYLPGYDPPSTILQHSLPYPDCSKTFLLLWQSLLVAQAQRCVYGSLSCGQRSSQNLLAKLAAAAVPLYATVESIVVKDGELATPLLTPFAGLVTGWAVFARAWGMYMSCRAEFHQSQLSRERKQFGHELARLDVAYQYATMCKELIEQSPSDGLVELSSLVDQTLQDLKERIDQVEQEGHNQPVPSREELIEIIGQKLINIDQPLSKLLKAKNTDPIFQNVPTGPDIKHYMEVLELEMDQRLRQITNLCEERSQWERRTLADVNLPHVLTVYRQQGSTGRGLPEDLWQRVEVVQREQRVTRLKQELWELRDMADLTRSTFQKIVSQLDFDLDSDRIFRKDNPSFDGHYAEEVQRNFRESLTNYDRLLTSAKGGDDTLLKRLNQLDMNPKFKLLQFQKSQLDMLLSGSREGGQPNARPLIDTSPLDRILTELSTLSNEREIMLNSLYESVKNFDFETALESEVGQSNVTDEIYQEAIVNIRKSFDRPFHDLQLNIERQEGLVKDMLAEYEQFHIARERSNNSHPGDSCIVMIEDALGDIEELSGHLKEGKGFYNVILPKLEKLKHQVDDVSARLTVERLEYDDRVNRARQEEKDAMIAQKLLSDNASIDTSNGCSTNGETSKFDEAVATLIAMDFDPAKVVEALKKYNNNFDEALNDLLSS